MTRRRPALAPAIARSANTTRAAAALLIAGLLRRDLADVLARIEALPPRRQASVVGATLGLLLLACLFAAQFGLPALLALFLGLIALVN